MSEREGGREARFGTCRRLEKRSLSAHTFRGCQLSSVTSGNRHFPTRTDTNQLQVREMKKDSQQQRKPSVDDWKRVFGARSAAKNVKLDGTTSADWARVFGGSKRSAVSKKKVAPTADDWKRLLGGSRK